MPLPGTLSSASGAVRSEAPIRTAERGKISGRRSERSSGVRKPVEDTAPAGTVIVGSAALRLEHPTVFGQPSDADLAPASDAIRAARSIDVALDGDQPHI